MSDIQAQIDAEFNDPEFQRLLAIEEQRIDLLLRLFDAPAGEIKLNMSDYPLLTHSDLVDVIAELEENGVNVVLSETVADLAKGAFFPRSR